MDPFVAFCTERHQILGIVIAEPTPRLNVMDLKFLHASTRMATPAVSFQDFTAELAIGFSVKPQAGPFCSYTSHIVP